MPVGWRRRSLVPRRAGPAARYELAPSLKTLARAALGCAEEDEELTAVHLQHHGRDLPCELGLVPRDGCENRRSSVSAKQK